MYDSSLIFNKSSAIALKMCCSNFLLWKLCFQGDRFGGALDAAARLFSHGVDSGQAPMEFVNEMRKKGELIMGIGHRVKSVSTLRAGAPDVDLGWRYFRK